MPCRRCNDEEKIREYVRFGDHESDSYAMVDCPLCTQYCNYCTRNIKEMDDYPPLRDYQGIDFWCHSECLQGWITHGLGRELLLLKKLEHVLVAKHIYEGECGCDFPGGAHSNGCHARVDQMNDMIEAIMGHKPWPDMAA